MHRVGAPPSSRQQRLTRAEAIATRARATTAASTVVRRRVGHDSGVEDDRDRAVVDELDLHARAEDARRDPDAELVASASQKRSYSGSAHARRPRPPRSSAGSLARVGDQRELADDERLAADVERASGRSARRRSRRSAGARPWPRGASRSAGRVRRLRRRAARRGRADLATTVSLADRDRRARTRWTTARTRYSSVVAVAAYAGAARGRA